MNSLLFSLVIISSISDLASKPLPGTESTIERRGILPIGGGKGGLLRRTPLLNGLNILSDLLNENNVKQGKEKESPSYENSKNNDEYNNKGGNYNTPNTGGEKGKNSEKPKEGGKGYSKPTEEYKPKEIKPQPKEEKKDYSKPDEGYKPKETKTQPKEDKKEYQKPTEEYKPKETKVQPKEETKGYSKPGKTYGQESPVEKEKQPEGYTGAKPQDYSAPSKQSSY